GATDVVQASVRGRLLAFGKAAAVCTIVCFSSRRRHTRCLSDWSSDVCSSDLLDDRLGRLGPQHQVLQVEDDVGDVFLDAGHHVRSEERRVGKECRSRGWRYLEKTNRSSGMDDNRLMYY